MLEKTIDFRQPKITRVCVFVMALITVSLKVARLDRDLVYPRKWKIRVAVNPSNNHSNALGH